MYPGPTTASDSGADGTGLGFETAKQGEQYQNRFVQLQGLFFVGKWFMRPQVSSGFYRIKQVGSICCRLNWFPG